MSRGGRERVRNGAIWHFVLKERERDGGRDKERMRQREPEG